MKDTNKKGIKIFGMITLVYFLVVIFLELFLFNFNYFFYGEKKEALTEVVYHNVEPHEDNAYEITDGDAFIEIKNIDCYVNTLEFKTDFFYDTIYLEVEYNGKVKDDYINIYGKKAIPIHENVDAIKINIVDGKDQLIVLDGFYAVNRLEINVFRIGLFMLAYLLVAVLVSLCLRKTKIKLEFIFLIFILCFGGMSSLMTPLFHSLDEGEHYIKAYNLANKNLIMVAGEKIEYPVGFNGFLTRKAKYANENFEDTYPKYRTYTEFLHETNALLKYGYKETEEKYFPSTAENYTPFPYVVSAMGIALGRAFQAPALISFYLGRIFNLLLYGILIFFAIKWIPLGKRLLFLCALIPTTVFLAGVFTSDGMINAFSLFVFSLILKWRFEKKKIRLPQAFVIVLCFFLITASKVTYVPFCLMILLLGDENFDTRKRKIFTRIGVLCLGALSFLLVYSYASLMGLSLWPIEGVDSTAQIIFVLTHPIEYIGIIFRTLAMNVEILTTGATVLVAYVGQLSWFSFYLIWFMLFFTAITDMTPKRCFIGKNERIILGFVIIMSIVLSMSALYVGFTKVGAPVIDGFQGRYMIPIIFPTLFLFQRKKWVPNIDEDKLNMILTGFTGSMLLYLTVYSYLEFYL